MGGHGGAATSGAGAGANPLAPSPGPVLVGPKRNTGTAWRPVGAEGNLGCEETQKGPGGRRGGRGGRVEVTLGARLAAMLSERDLGMKWKRRSWHH